MRKNKNHAFTLVELLIVIVVIGILSAMMMLSSTEAVTSAKVAKIISNLKNLKTAALAFYADNIDECQNYDDAAISRAADAGMFITDLITITPVQLCRPKSEKN